MEFINKLMIGVINNPDFIHGMTFNGVEHIEERFFDGWNYFKTLSPFLIKTYANKKTYSFLTLDDNDFENKLEEYLKTLRRHGLMKKQEHLILLVLNQMANLH